MRTIHYKIICFLLIVFVTGCSTLLSIRQPEVAAVRPRITSIDFESIRLAMDVHVRNPYPFRIGAVPAQLQLTVNGKKIFQGEIATATPIALVQTGKVTFPVALNYSDLFRLGKELANASEVKYTASGVVRVPVMNTTFDIPFSHQDSLPILRPPTVSALKVQLSDVTLSKAKIVADAEMCNPNSFEVGIKNLSFALNLGNAKVGGLKAVSNAVPPKSKERLLLSGEISAKSGLIDVLMNGVSGPPEISAIGLLQTPYGEVKL
jgi:LEA14-like dessication related protein